MDNKTDRQTTAELADQFALPGVLAFTGDARSAAGLTQAVITSPLAEATIYLQGAHLASWTPTDQRPVLFLSSKSEFAVGKAIRGGVPIVFPWFGPRIEGRAGPSHGFARTLPWTVEAASLHDDGSVAIAFLLQPNDTTRWFGYDAFQLRYRLTIGQSLGMELEVRNESTEPLVIAEALHSYFSVSDVRSIAVSGLEGAAYIDKAAGSQGAMPSTPSASSIRFAGETDSVYLGTTAPCVITDPGYQRRIIIEKSGSGSTVVWNPWFEKAHALADMGDDEWPNMVCVESGNVAEDAIRIAPHAVHAMMATVHVEAVSTPLP